MSRTPVPDGLPEREPSLLGEDVPNGGNRGGFERRGADPILTTREWLPKIDGNHAGGDHASGGTAHEHQTPLWWQDTT